MKSLFVTLLLGVVVGRVNSCPNTQECRCDTNPSELPTLYCAREGLTDVPQFSHTTLAFKEVTLAGNPITALPENSFKTTSGEGLNTKILDLSDTDITSINVAAFSGLESSLEVLKLHVKAMNSFPTQAIKDLKNLKQIEFKGFDFAQLPQNALSGLTNLEIVSFDTCQLTTLNSADFTSQVNSLREVYLIHNQFTTVPTQALSTLNQLVTLDLSENQIHTIPTDAFATMNALQGLALSQNGLNTITSGAFNGVEDTLKTLSLSNNNEGIVEADLSPVSVLRNLESLDLSYNSIESIPNQFFRDMSKLKTFSANRNKITSLSSQSFQGLGASFNKLSLHDNLISSIDTNTFAGLSSLKVLDLDNNQILGSTLDSNTFSGLENTLEDLSLTETGFTDLQWPSIGGLSKLKLLKLNRNSILRVPDNTFINLGQLQSLNLQANQISVVKQTSFKGLQFTLEKIFLDSNSIRTVGECVFYKYVRLTEIYLDSNPLHCDCQLQWLNDFIYNNMVPQTLFWQCDTPSNHNGKFFRDVPKNELTCTTTPVNQVCEDYTITTPTTSPTINTSPTIGYPLYLNITEVTDQSMQANWQVSDVSSLNGWQVKATDIASGEVHFEQVFGVNVRDCLINNLLPDTLYYVCLIPIMAASPPTVNSLLTPSCSSERTMPKGSGILSPENRLQVILGSVFGLVVVIVIVIVIVLCYVRWRNSRNPPVFKDDDGVSNDGSFVPQVGYQSKRFSKPKAHMLVNMNGCTPQEMERRLEGFTPEERDRILRLFSTTGASTLSVLSTQSLRYSHEPYGTRPGYINPLQTSQSHGRLYSGEYDEIPADTYDEIPADTQEGQTNGAYNIPFENEERPKSTGDILGGASSYV